MRTYKSLLIAVLVFVSCNNPTTRDESSPKESNTTKTSESLNVNQAKATLPTEDFSVFWERFRMAVVNSDTTQIISMTLFPFKARGTFDDDPIIKYNRQKFIPMFQAFLKQGSGLGETTEFDEIKKTTKPKPTDVNGNYARISDLAFDKTDQGWKFSFAYLDYAIIDSLKK
jgi:hypothetical protein